MQDLVLNGFHPFSFATRLRLSILLASTRSSYRTLGICSGGRKLLLECGQNMRRVRDLWLFLTFASAFIAWGTWYSSDSFLPSMCHNMWQECDLWHTFLKPKTSVAFPEASIIIIPLDPWCSWYFMNELVWGKDGKERLSRSTVIFRWVCLSLQIVSPEFSSKIAIFFMLVCELLS